MGIRRYRREWHDLGYLDHVKERHDKDYPKQQVGLVPLCLGKKREYSANDIEHDLGQFTRPDEPESVTSFLSSSISDSSALYSLSFICRYLRVIRALSEMPRGVSW